MRWIKNDLRGSVVGWRLLVLSAWFGGDDWGSPYRTT